jgi:hypothetical protein
MIDQRMPEWNAKLAWHCKTEFLGPSSAPFDGILPLSHSELFAFGDAVGRV